jgi:6-phosphogluconolactonase
MSLSGDAGESWSKPEPVRMRVDLKVLPTADALADTAARRFMTVAEAAIESRGEFVVALSGGSTPRRMYERLASEPFASRLDWSRIQILWGDERCVPPTAAVSNYRMVRESLLDRVSVPSKNVHRIRGEDDPAFAAAEYEGVLRRVLRTPFGPARSVPDARIDLVLLGLGEDGHTASIFPESAAGRESVRWVVADYAAQALMWRVTLTPVIINGAAEVMFLVAGSEKAAILQRVLEGSYRPHELPAQLIAPVAGRGLWLVDESAASELHGTAEPQSQ